MILKHLHIFAVDGVLYEIVKDTQTGQHLLFDERGARAECDLGLFQIRKALTKLQSIR